MFPLRWLRFFIDLVVIVMDAAIIGIELFSSYGEVPVSGEAGWITSMDPPGGQSPPTLFTSVA